MDELQVIIIMSKRYSSIEVRWVERGKEEHERFLISATKKSYSEKTQVR